MREYEGFIYLFMASFSASSGALAGKLASSTWHSFDLVLIRFIGQLTIVSILCLWKGINPYKEPFIIKQIMRGLLGAITFTSAIWANSNMELSNATMIRFVGPLFTMLLAKVVLKESISNIKIVSLFVGFLGVGLVAKPAFLFGQQSHNGDYPNRHLAVVANIVSALTLSVSTVLTKSIINKIHILSLMYFFALVSLFATLPLQFLKQHSGTFGDLTLPIILALCYFFSQMCSNMGIKSVPASVATLIQISDTLFGVFYGVLVFGEKLDFFSLVGCFMVLSVSFLLAFEKYRLGKGYNPPAPNYVQLPIKGEPEINQEEEDEIELEQIIKHVNK